MSLLLLLHCLLYANQFFYSPLASELDIVECKCTCEGATGGEQSEPPACIMHAHR